MRYSARVRRPSSLPHTPMSFEAAHLDGTRVGGAIIYVWLALQCSASGLLLFVKLDEFECAYGRYIHIQRISTIGVVFMLVLETSVKKSWKVRGEKGYWQLSSSNQLIICSPGKKVG